ncbi:MAG: replicative DNA helicase [Alphaproteobacteria bacterium]
MEAIKQLTEYLLSPGSEDPRTPPKSIELEQALLGGLMLNNEKLDDLADFLQPEHFSEEAHAKIFDTLTKLSETGQFDALKMRPYFENEQLLASAGYGQYLEDLQTAAVPSAPLRDYGQAIHDLYLRRQLIDTGADLINEAFDQDVDDPASIQIERAEAKLFSLAENGLANSGPVSLSDATTNAVKMIADAVANPGAVSGLATNFTELDQTLGGLQKSDLLILAARPAMGKTALATNTAINACRYKNAKVAFFSMEMSAEQLATRLLAEVSGISSSKLRKGDFDQRDFYKIHEAGADLEKMAFFIDDTPALSIPSLRTRARRLKRTHGGLDLIIVDYLQLMQGTGRGGSENRVQEISEISRGLKAVAKELDLPIIALSQLSRQVEARDDKRPQLADLRESGSIEQDADVVMFIYRQAYYDRQREPQQRAEENVDEFQQRHTAWVEHMAQIDNKATLIIGKNRHGPTRDIPLFFEGAITKFSNLEDDYSIAPTNND